MSLICTVGGLLADSSIQHGVARLADAAGPPAVVVAVADGTNNVSHLSVGEVKNLSLQSLLSRTRIMSPARSATSTQLPLLFIHAFQVKPGLRIFPGDFFGLARLDFRRLMQINFRLLLVQNYGDMSYLGRRGLNFYRSVSSGFFAISTITKMDYEMLRMSMP